MFNWLNRFLLTFRKIQVDESGLPTMAECERLRDLWWHNSGKPLEYGSFAPNINAPRPFDSVFDLVIAQKIVHHWVVMHHGVKVLNSLHWGTLEPGIGANCHKHGWLILGSTHLDKIEITLNSLDTQVWDSLDTHWWRVLAHEMAHVPTTYVTTGHEANGFGIHLVRAKLFLERELEAAVARRNTNRS